MRLETAADKRIVLIGRMQKTHARGAAPIQTEIFGPEPAFRPSGAYPNIRICYVAETILAVVGSAGKTERRQGSMRKGNFGAKSLKRRFANRPQMATIKST